jgi:hypothetical protein
MHITLEKGIVSRLPFLSGLGEDLFLLKETYLSRAATLSGSCNACDQPEEVAITLLYAALCLLSLVG